MSSAARMHWEDLIRRKALDETEAVRVNPDMLILAREYAGHSQSSLARLLPFTQTTLSRYESGLVEPSAEHLKAISRALGKPESFFFRQEKVYGASGFFHRKQSGLTMHELRMIHANVNELRIRAKILLRDAEVETDHVFHRIASARTPEDAARQLRGLWQLPTGPIRNVVEVVESAGGIVFWCSFPTRNRIDGLSQWPVDDRDARPVFFLNGEAPGDRQRFTLCHEIGHVVLHHIPPDGDPEDQANRFAGEFLLPEDEVADDLCRLTLEKAAALKACWKVSMAAIIRRALSLGCISDRHYRYLNMQMAKCGFKKNEPEPIPPETPALFDAVLQLHRQDLGRTDEQLAKRLDMTPDEFLRTYGFGKHGLRLVM